MDPQHSANPTTDSISDQARSSRPQVILTQPRNRRADPQSAPSDGSAAIVRPVDMADGQKRTARMDTAESSKVRTPHLRTHQLDDYVNWLTRDSVGTEAVAKPEPKPTGRDFESDLEQILHKLNMPDVLRQESSDSMQLKTEIEKNQDLGLTKPEVENSGNGAIKSDDIIHTVSQAIASVINEYSQEEVEQRIRSGMAVEKPHVDSPKKFVESPPASPDPVDSETQTKVEEIPVHVAAWEVEDFRWPKITDHMLQTEVGAIDELAKTVLRSLKPNQQRLVVTSPEAGAGVTSIACSLARCISDNGGRVLLVDANLSHPGLTSGVGLGTDISWLNAVHQSLESAEALIRSKATGLCIVPLAPAKPDIQRPQFIYNLLGQLVGRVRSNFDLIIFDVGPAKQLTSETTSPDKLADVGLIVHDGVSAAPFIATKDRLEKLGLTQLVVAQNSTQQRSSRAA